MSDHDAIRATVSTRQDVPDIGAALLTHALRTLRARPLPWSALLLGIGDGAALRAIMSDALRRRPGTLTVEVVVPPTHQHTLDPPREDTTAPAVYRRITEALANALASDAPGGTFADAERLRSGHLVQLTGHVAPPHRVEVMDLAADLVYLDPSCLPDPTCWGHGAIQWATRHLRPGGVLLAPAAAPRLARTLAAFGLDAHTTPDGALLASDRAATLHAALEPT